LIASIQVVFVDFFKRPVWLVALLCLGCSAQSLSPEANQRIERQVRAHFKVPDAVTVTVGTPKPSEFTGYDAAHHVRGWRAEEHP